MEIEVPKIYELRLHPTYAVYYRQRSQNTYGKSHKITWTPSKTPEQIENEKNLKDNATKGVLSKKATGKLKNAINWLVVSSKSKMIKNPKSGKFFSFKINLITLTLPSEQIVSDNKIKSDLLNPFLVLLRSRYDFQNYVWKAEAQENGNIHFHITTDTYIPHEELNFLWNRLLKKKGYMQAYRDKFRFMSFDNYKQFSNEYTNATLSDIKKRFEFGTATNWERPNSTDIHAVKNVKDLAAYLASYMSKKEEGKRPLEGRLWGCSYALSNSNKCTIEITPDINTRIFSKFENLCKKVKPIYSEPNQFGQFTTLATIFMYDFNSLFKSCNDWIRDAFTAHIETIRNYNTLKLAVNQ